MKRRYRIAFLTGTILIAIYWLFFKDPMRYVPQLRPGSEFDSPLADRRIKLPQAVNRNIRPGLPKGVEPPVNVYRKPEPEKVPYRCTKLHSLVGFISICIHDPAKDLVISGALNSNNMWEGELIVPFQNLLQIEPGLHLIDIGANLGVFSLMAAKWDRKVVAVDANIENIKRLRKSCQINDFVRKILILWNAISDGYGKVSIKIDQTNIGAAFVNGPGDDVDTILLDDLVPFVTFKRALLKIDIESSLVYAFEFAAELFDKVDLPFVIMEWEKVRLTNKGKVICDFMKNRGYKPYSSPYGGHQLDANYKLWTYDVTWIRKIRYMDFMPILRS